MSAKALRVFVVEDEAMIRMMVVDMIEELGHVLAAEAGQIDQALEPAQSAEFDLANVSDMLIRPVAELIKARGRPIIFATGYGSEGLPEGFRDFPALPKPYQLETLAAAIDSVIRSRGA